MNLTDITLFTLAFLEQAKVITIDNTIPNHLLQQIIEDTVNLSLNELYPEKNKTILKIKMEKL